MVIEGKMKQHWESRSGKYRTENRIITAMGERESREGGNTSKLHHQRSGETQLKPAVAVEKVSSGNRRPSRQTQRAHSAAAGRLIREERIPPSVEMSGESNPEFRDKAGS